MNLTDTLQLGYRFFILIMCQYSVYIFLACGHAGPFPYRASCGLGCTESRKGPNIHQVGWCPYCQEGKDQLQRRQSGDSESAVQAARCWKCLQTKIACGQQQRVLLGNGQQNTSSSHDKAKQSHKALGADDLLQENKPLANGDRSVHQHGGRPWEL